MTNSKSYMCFRLVPKSVTLNDLERRDGYYYALFAEFGADRLSVCSSVKSNACRSENADFQSTFSRQFTELSSKPNLR